MHRRQQIDSNIIFTIVYAVSYTAFLLLTPQQSHRPNRKHQRRPATSTTPNNPPAPKTLRAEAPIFTPVLTDRLPIVATTNARSISNKTELLTQFLADAKIDVAIVTETWLHDNNTKIVEAQFRGNFSVVSTTRNGRRGGGVSILVSKMKEAAKRRRDMALRKSGKAVVKQQAACRHCGRLFEASRGVKIHESRCKSAPTKTKRKTTASSSPT